MSLHPQFLADLRAWLLEAIEADLCEATPEERDAYRQSAAAMLRWLDGGQRA